MGASLGPLFAMDFPETQAVPDSEIIKQCKELWYKPRN